MFKKIILLSLIIVIANLTTANFVYAGSKSDKETRFAEKVKKGIATLGTGEKALVEVKLRNNTKIKGYIKEAGENSFVVVDPRNGVEREIPYPDTKQIRGNNLSTGAKVAIGLAILAGVLGLLLFFENYG